MKMRLRFGIVGFGLHAVKRLMPGFGASEHTTVTALSRRNAELAEKSAAEYRIPHWFTSTDELCACPDVDAVLVTSPNSTHLADVLTAVAHSKPVLVEKPMAMNADECRRMIEAAHGSSVLLGVAQVFRFTQSLARIRALIEEGAIGQPLFARSEFSYNGLGHARSWIASREVSGGGPIMDVGVHCVDALRFVLQQEVVATTATANFDQHWPDVEAAAVMALRFDQGCLAAVLVSARAEYRTPIEIVGSNGTIRAGDALTVEHPITIEVLRNGKVVHSEEVNNSGAYARQVDAFALAVRGEQPFPAGAEDGLRNQIILDAAYRSIFNNAEDP
jgi:1,5-anhydro-D-fructose reductase (1,5-anhydro-D-mannitol-forming)